LNFFGDKKWNFGFSENFRSFFLFFIISLFSKKILEKPFSINILTLKSFRSLENRDWERRGFQKRFLRRFWRARRKSSFFSSNFLKKFFFVD